MFTSEFKECIDEPVSRTTNNTNASPLREERLLALEHSLQMEKQKRLNVEIQLKESKVNADEVVNKHMDKVKRYYDVKVDKLEREIERLKWTSQRQQQQGFYANAGSFVGGAVGGALGSMSRSTSPMATMGGGGYGGDQTVNNYNTGGYGNQYQQQQQGSQFGSQPGQYGGMMGANGASMGRYSTSPMRGNHRHEQYGTAYQQPGYLQDYQQQGMGGYGPQGGQHALGYRGATQPGMQPPGGSGGGGFFSWLFGGGGNSTALRPPGPQGGMGVQQQGGMYGPGGMPIGGMMGQQQQRSVSPSMFPQQQGMMGGPHGLPQGPMSPMGQYFEGGPEYYDQVLAEVVTAQRTGRPLMGGSRSPSRYGSPMRSQSPYSQTIYQPQHPYRY